MHYAACDKQMKSWADLELITSQGLGSDTSSDSMRTQIVIGEMLGRFQISVFVAVCHLQNPILGNDIVPCTATKTEFESGLAFLRYSNYNMIYGVG